jgi:SPP1 family predicted phage head-tail adaptor
MNPGRLNRRIVIQEATTFTRDSFGATVPVWEDVDEVWASKTPLSASERFQAGQIYADATDIFGMRYRELNPASRISYQGRIYNIRSIIDKADKQTELQVLTSVEAS